MARFIVSFCLLALVAAVLSAPANNSKVDSLLRKTLETKQRVNILITMKQSVETAARTIDACRSTIASRSERNTAYYNAMRAFTQETQAPVLEMLRSPRFFAINVQSFWIVNMIYVQGADSYLIESLAAMDEVAS